jgi:hypothetical protein
VLYKKFQVDRQLLLLGISIKLTAKSKILESFIPICIIFTGLLYHLSGARKGSLMGNLQAIAMFLEILILSSIAQLGYICCSDLQDRFCHINYASCRRYCKEFNI